jgi:glycosyltransferase involved in cell wall biosynthesis
MKLRISVVVPTYQRPDLLGRCLAALDAQDLDPVGYEVIVADDAASAITRQQVEGFAGQARASVVYVPVTGAHGPAAARNAGWRRARGDVIAFTDDDCIPDRGWLAAGLAAFAADAQVIGASGRVVVPLPDKPTDYERDAAGLEGAEFVTANCFCRCNALAALGGFDERFSAAWREDSDLHFGLLNLDGRVLKVPDAVVVHPVRPAPWGVSLRQQKKSLFDALLYKKHPDHYCQRVRRDPPWDYYGTVAALGLAAGAIWTERPGWTLAALGTWAFLTGRFCVRRLRGTSRAPEHVAELLVTSALIPPLSVFWRLYGACKFRVFFL